jgi:Sulfatase-modifying factor enzyme 1
MGSKVGYAVPISTARFALEGWGIEFTEGDDALLPKEVVDKYGVTTLLVSRGGFPMGAQQQHVYLDAFYIDKTPATQAKTWNDAANYCTARGKRLPTEGEWEKAVRGKLISLTSGQWEWVADWYQSDYPRMRPNRNPAGPSVGESNASELAQWDDRLRSKAEQWTESLCRVPDECKKLEPGQGCWKGASCTTLTCCSESDRRFHYESYLQGQRSARPKMDMKKVLRKNTDSRSGSFSQSNEFIYRCVREPDR